MNEALSIFDDLDLPPCLERAVACGVAATTAGIALARSGIARTGNYVISPTRFDRPDRGARRRRLSDES